MRTKRWLPLIVLPLLLSACRLDVRVTTTLDASGDGGRIAVALELDEQLRGRLAADPQGSVDLEGSMRALRARAWNVTERVTARGGLRIDAMRRFESEQGLRAALQELRDARGDGVSTFGDLRLDLSYDVSRSFLRTRAVMRGTIDTTPGTPIDEATRQAFAELVRFEVRANLPGSPTVRDAGGLSTNGAVVWHPELGRTMAIAATSSAVRAGSVLMIVAPAFLVLLALFAFVVRRRRRVPAGIVRLPEAVEPVRAAEPVLVVLDVPVETEAI